MQALILGAGDAFTRKHFGSSALIAPRGFRGGDGTPARGPFLLLDCPDPIHRVLAEGAGTLGVEFTALDVHDIIITHLHGDHSNGLESFGFLRRIARSRGMDSPPPRLHTSAPAADRLWQKLAPAMDAPASGTPDPSTLHDFFEVHLLRPDRPSSIAGLTVECRFTKHPVPTIGLLISDGRRTLGWSGDTAFDQAHIDWLSRADLIVHECNLGPAHTPLDALQDLPADIKDKMKLIHTPDDFDPRSTTLPMLREGDLLTI